MVCPKCGYALTPFEKECPRCPRLTRQSAEPVKEVTVVPKPAVAVKNESATPLRIQPPTPGVYCSNCRMPLWDQYVICPHCNAQVTQDRQRANGGLIVLMWGITVFSYIVGPSGGGVLFDLSTIPMAIGLARSKNATDRTNGWIKLTLEVLGLISGFFQGLSMR